MKIKFMSKRLRLREKMFNHIRRWESSGLSQRGYCDKARISRTQFHYWMKIHRSAQIDDDPMEQFLPVVIKEPLQETSDQQIVVSCPNGLVITFPHMPSSISLIRQLIMV
jgi:hypothetical protein